MEGVKVPTLPLPLARAIARHRRALAAVAAAVAVLATITALQPDRGPTVAVVVAARPLSSGVTVTDADLTLAEVPVALVPSDALTNVADAVGHSINAPVTLRSIFTSATVASGQALASPGHVVVALPLADESIARLVKPGTRLDLLAATASATGVLARDVRVVAAPQPEGGTFGSLNSGRVALVEVTPEVAVQVAQSARSGGVTIAVR